MATDPERGDLIAIFRPLGYQHWALYVGNGYVVHLVRETGAGFSSGSSSSRSSSSRSSSSRSSSSRGYVGEDEAIVEKEKLKYVAGRDKYCVRNLLDKRRKPRPIDEIVKEALSRVGEIRPYNVIKNNCEHFVTELRYGEPFSLQGLLAEAAGAMGAVVVDAAVPQPVRSVWEGVTGWFRKK